MRVFFPGFFAIWSLGTSILWGAENNYAGGVAALATLSADGRYMISSAGSQVSLYSPKNGPALDLFLGRYLKDYVSVQGNFIWNANDLTLVSTTTSPQGGSYYSEVRGSSQTAVTGDVLVFFRDRHSRLRPYLSVGTGIVHLQSSQRQIEFVSGSPVLPPMDFSANNAVLRVAVGIDVKLRRGFCLRYSFSETISPNPISD